MTTEVYVYASALDAAAVRALYDENARFPTAAPTATRAPAPAPTPRPTAACASVAFATRVVSDASDGACGVHAVDVDGDGDVDVVSGANVARETSWHANDGAESFSTSLVGSHGGRDVHALDLDGDGDVDVLYPLLLAHVVQADPIHAAGLDELGDEEAPDDLRVRLRARRDRRRR